jgi:hypothetical protein
MIMPGISVTGCPGLVLTSHSRVRIFTSYQPFQGAICLPARCVMLSGPEPLHIKVSVLGGLQIVWVALLTFVNEILLGPQGILNLLQRKAEL